jgi:hypothetical protein
MVEPRIFSVGETVRFNYGTRKVTGIVKEHRGPIGINGRRLYRIRFTPDVDSEIWLELPAVELQLVEDADRSKS